MRVMPRQRKMIPRCLFALDPHSLTLLETNFTLAYRRAQMGCDGQGIHGIGDQFLLRNKLCRNYVGIGPYSFNLPIPVI